MTFIETYELLAAGGAFIVGWSAAMLTGLLVTRAL